MKKTLVIILFSVSMQLHGQSNLQINSNIESAYHEILSLRFNNADRILNAERSIDPENTFVPYLKNYIDFLKVFITEDEHLFEQLEENKTERVDRIEKLPDDNPYKNYMLGNINLQWAVARLKFQEYFTAAFEINRAYRLLSDNKERFPDFVPNQVSMGVMHIMIGLVPEKYHWLLKIINMEGDVDEGKRELRGVLDSALIDEQYAHLKDEVLFYLGFVELNIYPDQKTLDYLLSELEKTAVDNLLHAYLRINILMKTGNNDQVLDEFGHLPRSEDYFQFIYLDYLEAEANLRTLNLEKSEIHYDLFLSKFTGQNFVKDAYRKKGWIALIREDSATYLKLMIMAADSGYTHVGQDKDAEREAMNKIIPVTGLVKSRLFFDGGYYSKADSTLNKLKNNALTDVQLLEKTYRIARIAHQSNRIDTAKKYYIKTIARGKESPRYFAGNSALKLGEIFETQRDSSEAAFYYKLCLDLDFEEYESGIHSKAKAGLRRVME